MAGSLPERLSIAALILLFFYTSVSKLADLAEFRQQLANQVIPKWSVGLLLWLLPTLELVLALALIFNRTRKVALYGAALITSLFTIYIGLVLLQIFPRVPCSCGGVLKSMGFTTHLIFNLFFLALSFFALRQQNSRQ